MYLYLALCIILAIWISRLVINRDHPLQGMPGPAGIPVFGNMFQLDFKRAHIPFFNWAKTYGDVFKVNLAGKHVVIVSGITSLHEMLIKKGKDFAGRPQQNFRIASSPISSNQISFRNPVGNWHHSKKLLLKHIQGYGLGFKNIEAIVTRVVDKMIVELNDCADSGAPIDLGQCIMDRLWSITYTMTFGMEITAQELQHFNHINNTCLPVLSPGGSGELLDMWPWLRHVGHPLWPIMQKVVSLSLELNTIWKNRLTSDGNSHKEGNLLQQLFDEIAGENPHGLSEEQALALCWDLIGPGAITSSATLRMLLNVFAHKPEVQEVLHCEQQRVLGGREVTYTDYNTMHYHHATILEALRYGTVVPMSLPHETTRNTTLSRFHIPKGTLVLCNLWTLSHSEDFWTDPWEFRPERFLDVSGSILPPDHENRVHLMPFGAGPRVCPGSTFAIVRMFLIMAKLVESFEILPESEVAGAQPSCDCRDMMNGIILVPPEYKVRLSRRVLSHA